MLHFLNLWEARILYCEFILLSSQSLQDFCASDGQCLTFISGVCRSQTHNSLSLNPYGYSTEQEKWCPLVCLLQMCYNIYTTRMSNDTRWGITIIIYFLLKFTDICWQYSGTRHTVNPPHIRLNKPINLNHIFSMYPVSTRVSNIFLTYPHMSLSDLELNSLNTFIFETF